MKNNSEGEIGKECVQLLKKGDQEAFSAIFDHYHSRLFHFCFRFLKSKDLSDEVVQETFLKIWKAKSQIDEKQNNFSAYIFKIARNLTIDQLRKEVRDSSFKAVLKECMISYSNNTEEAIHFSDLSHELSKSINELPPQRQKIFRLSREMGLSHEEIANKLGISNNTVKGSIFKSLKYLKSALSDYNVNYHIILLFLFN